MKITLDAQQGDPVKRMEHEQPVAATVQLLAQEPERRPYGNSLESDRKIPSRRSQLEVRMDMLAAVKDGAEKPTQIMYKANLSWISLQCHLKQLLEHGLLKWAADGNRKRYELTIKGANVMNSFIQILEATGEDTTDFLTVGQ